MSKNRRNVQNAPPPVLHHTEAGRLKSTTSATAESEGHVVYPQLVNANTSSAEESKSSAGFGPYAPTSDADSVPDSQNEIAWTEWVQMEGRSLLLLAYRPSGFQVWDLSQLDTAREVLHLPSIGTVISACIQPPPAGVHRSDSPRLLLLAQTGDGVVFSAFVLQSYACVKRIEIPGAKRVQANRKFVIISVESVSSHTSTAGIHILSATDDYNLLHTINNTLLAPHTLTEPIVHLSSTRLLAYSSAIPPVHRISTHSPYTGTSYPPVSVNDGTPIPRAGGGPASALTSSLAYVGTGVLTGAMRLGAGVVEGVKLGINASGYGGTPSSALQRSEAERSAFSRSAPASHASPLSSRGHNRKASGQRRSAVGGPGYGTGVGEQSPDTDSGQWITVLDLEPLLSSMERNVLGDLEHPESSQASSSRLSRASSFVVNQPSLTQLPGAPAGSSPPEIVSEFQYLPGTSLASTLMYRSGGTSASASNTDVRTSSLTPAPSNADEYLNSAVSALQWNSSGTMLAVGGRDGGALKVFRIVRTMRAVSNEKKSGSGRADERLADKVQLVYELQRGMTPAVVQDIRWSADGLWAGLISDKGTIHIFPIVPDGGQPGGRSHVLGRLMNNDAIFKKDAPIRLSALCRLRRPYIALTEPTTGSISGHESDSFDAHDTRHHLSSFLFLPQTVSRASHRLPSPPQQASPKSLVVAEDISHESDDGFQDLLAFDRETGLLALWRIHLRLVGVRENSGPGADTTTGRPIERTTTLGYHVNPGVPPSEEAQLPSTTPSNLPAAGLLGGVARLSAYARNRELQLPFSLGSSRLTSTDSVIASWSLRREDDWKEYKQLWPSTARAVKKSGRGSLFHAEVTPSTTRSGRVPRPIYLSHQFQFAALTNDYHALVRKLDLDPPSLSLLVRKESVIVRTGEGFPNETGHETSVPSEFDSDAHFLGTNPHLLDLTDSPLLGGHLGLAIDNAPFSSSLASTNSISSHSRSSRPGARRSFDENLTSAMESRLQLDASYSPSGSSSDIASPGHVIPMLPNGRPGSSGSGTGLATGIDAVVRGTTRVGKEMWGGLSNVRSPRLLPTKRNSATPDLLKFDEEEEMFIVDDLDVPIEGAGASPKEPLASTSVPDSTLRKEESVTTIAPGIWLSPGSVAYPRMTDSGMTIIGPQRSRAGSQTPGSTEDPSWVEQTDVYAQAVEEDVRFHDVTRILDEEREEREHLQRKMGQMSTTAPSTPDMSKSRSGKKGSSRKKKK
ncbi:hypothetical protein FRC17_005551 [Serendipita sp. 399]|nr:hypothetical protein FRC17_005551 [Serendipita sp. 399]